MGTHVLHALHFVQRADCAVLRCAALCCGVLRGAARCCAALRTAALADNSNPVVSYVQQVCIVPCCLQQSYHLFYHRTPVLEANHLEFEWLVFKTGLQFLPYKGQGRTQ